MRKVPLIDRDDVLGALIDALAQGRAAFKSGNAYRSDNPYKRGTQCRAMWYNGWERATADAEFFASETKAYKQARAQRMLAVGTDTDSGS